jgi:glutathione S-transferase
MLELYHGGTSVCSVKVRLAIEEKGLEWKSHYLSLTKCEHQTDEYKAINPNLKVPALVDDGVPLAESTVINEYLDDRFPDIPLKPEDPMGRTRMRLWTKQLDEGVHLAIGTITYCIAYRFRRLALSEEEMKTYLAKKPVAAHRERSRDRIFNGVKSKEFAPALMRAEKMLADMEDTLAECPYLAGDSYTLADAGFTPYVNRLDQLQLSGMWADRPRLTDWYDRMRARPSFKIGATDWFDDESLNLMAGKGGEEWPLVRNILAEATA